MIPYSDKLKGMLNSGRDCIALANLSFLILHARSKLSKPQDPSHSQWWKDNDLHHLHLVLCMGQLQLTYIYLH